MTELTVEERVAHVVIDRPEKRNAMSRAVLEQLCAHAEELAGRIDAREVGASPVDRVEIEARIGGTAVVIRRRADADHAEVPEVSFSSSSTGVRPNDDNT